MRVNKEYNFTEIDLDASFTKHANGLDVKYIDGIINLTPSFGKGIRMIEVEKILTAHLRKKLPSLEAIAHEVTLSVSTLKRHFKLMYGKSIYEYYLELKMNLAKHMLQEKPLSINEVAALLDYEKVSSFIEMFKKHHGFSPGNIRKNGILR